MQQHTVPLSKTKLLATSAACLLFVVIGWWLFNMTDAEIQSQGKFNAPWLVHGVGLAAMVLFGAMAPWIVGKLFDRTPGLQILDEGILENSNMFSMGLIAWEDIAGLEVYEIQRRKFIYVLLRDPEKYLSRCGNVKRSVLRYSMRLGPSPVTITSSSLAMSFPAVLELLEGGLIRYRETTKT
jgi:hypothetical protein